MSILIPILMMVASYLIGSIPFGLIIGKLKGIDIREHGSHNIGATNALRTLGKKLGFLVFILDFLKAAIVILVTHHIIDWQNDFFILKIHPLTYGMLAALGHLFPIFLKFKGGKGISCFIGILTLYSWPFAIIALVTFIIVVAITKYVSLGSTLAAIMVLIGYFIMCPNDLAFLIFIIIGNILIMYKHIPNYKRLIKGVENKILLK